MLRKRRKSIGLIKILLIIFFFSSIVAGCATLTPGERRQKKDSSFKEEGKRGITDNILVFRDLKQVDLDNDGEKEIVAIYDSGFNSSGVKVIKFSQGEGGVIFERIFNTPNTRFKIKNGIPTVDFEEVDCVAGRTSKGAYRWDGKTFVLKKSK